MTVRRVALIAEALLAPVPGGTGRYTRELAAALARTAPDAGTVTTWVAAHRDLDPARLPGVDGPHRFPLDARVLTRLWERNIGPAPRGADVVHATTPLFPPRRGRPLVVTVHDVVPWTHPETLTPRGAMWHRVAVTAAAQRADVIAVPTQATADALRERVRVRARVEVLGAGVTRFPTADAAVRARVDAFGLPEEFALTVSTLEPRKGLDVALAAWARLGPSAPVLAMVGQPGWGGVDPIAAALALGVPPDRLRVLGRVGDAELGELLHRATVLVAPSRAEGFGLPVVEAMAAGRPAVVSDDPAQLEVGGDAVLAVPRGDAAALADAVAALLRDPAEQARLGSAGRERARGFDWDDVARRAWAVYASL